MVGVSRDNRVGAVAGGGSQRPELDASRANRRGNWSSGQGAGPAERIVGIIPEIPAVHRGWLYDDRAGRGGGGYGQTAQRDHAKIN